jgi:hypothetical protein
VVSEGGLQMRIGRNDCLRYRADLGITVSVFPGTRASTATPAGSLLAAPVHRPGREEVAHGPTEVSR